MQNFCAVVQRVGYNWLTETIGWVVIVATIISLIVLGIVARSLGWPGTVGYSFLAIMTLGGAVGFTSFVIQTRGRSGLLFPVESVEYLGVLSFFMLLTSMLVGYSRLLGPIFG